MDSEGEDTEGFTEVPDDGKTEAERKEELRLAQEEKDYQTRMRHLRKRMNRATGEYEDLKKKIADMKARFNSPLPDPRICPQLPPVPPLPLKRRRRPHLTIVAGEDEDEDVLAGGDTNRIY
uniref:Cortactin-binding protein 2 n=1 Tax=Lygus hesperus TaxID=30085 RepID=A0A0A9ZJB3_LYGHE